MRPKPTPTHNAQETARSNRPAAVYLHAGTHRALDPTRLGGEHPAFNPGFVDTVRGVVWFELPGDHPACCCGMPAAPGRLDCADVACPGMVL